MFKIEPQYSDKVNHMNDFYYLFFVFLFFKYNNDIIL